MFIHLHCHSPYSFLDGASAIEEYINTALQFEMPALALTDHNNLSGAVDFYKQTESAGIKGIQGVEITVTGNFHLTILAENNRGYQNLCQILTKAYQSPQAETTFQTLQQYRDGIIVLSGCRRSQICQALLRNQWDKALQAANYLVEIFGKEQVYLEMTNSYLPKTNYLLEATFALHEKTNLPIVATNNVHYATKEKFPVHDLLVCTRTKTTANQIHPARPLNNENYFASPDEMKQRFAKYPQAITNTLEIAERCNPALALGEDLFPSFSSNFSSSHEHLTYLTWQGAKKRYGTLTKKIISRLEHELDIIGKLGVADYFLTVWDVVEYAKKAKIRHAGRGSAADSAVAYCLEITNVDAINRGLLFERFLSLERSQKPDIDIDFDARYRDQVAEYVYQKYGADKVASVCTFSTYYARSALRDFGKALGYNQAELSAITKGIPRVPTDGIRESLSRLPELKNHPLHRQKYHPLLEYCQAIVGFPRHIGTHLGGLVISGKPLTKVTPLQPSPKGVLITQFDKHTIEDLGLIKLDLLSLRTLSAVDQAQQNLEHKGFSYDQIPLNDKETYQMLNKGDTVGVFQLESPAQRNLQARLQADHFEDIVASVALIRPGPIKGDMVEPFIARRHGLEQASYIHPKLEPILAKTYGVVLYQEQVIEIATEIAGFTPGESDRLRRAMTKFRSHAEMKQIGDQFIQKAISKGVEKDIAETIFSYVLGYAGYGFCEAHAAAFSDTAYKTAFLLKHHPAHFYAALLNQQPMGFYPPNTLCVQARARGIKILPLDILQSEREFTATDNAIRIGLRQVRKIDDKQLDSLIKARQEQPFISLADFIFRTNLERDVIENLILGGAFDCFNPNRRGLLWKVSGYLKNRQGSLFFAEDSPSPKISDFSPKERWLKEYRSLGVTAYQHVMDFYRSSLRAKGYLSSKQTKEMTSGYVKTAGLVIRPHRPPTKSGKTVIFLTLEDEQGLIDVTIFEHVYQRFAKEIFSYPLLAVTGEISLRDQALSIIARQVSPLAKF